MVKNFDSITLCIETTDRSSIEWWRYPWWKILPYFIISYFSPPLWPMSTIWKLLSLNKRCNKTLLPSALFWTKWLYNYREIHIETCIAEGSVISHGDVKGRICEADFCPLSIVRYISFLHLISWFYPSVHKISDPMAIIYYKFDVCVTAHHWYNNINSQLDATITNFIDSSNQLNMFRAIISSILRRTWLCLQLVV